MVCVVLKETIEVNKSTQYLPEKGIFDKDPKTESSNRIVPIPNYITNVLLEYKDWYDEQKELYGDKWIDSNKLFLQANGKTMHPIHLVNGIKLILNL